MQTGSVATETERESPLPYTAKRLRGAHLALQTTGYIPLTFYPVCSPDHVEETKSIELVSSVSSLCLEEVPPSAGPSTTSTVILGSWSTMRKSSAPFVVGDDVTKAMFDF